MFALKIALAIAAMGVCLWYAAGDTVLWLAAAPSAKVVRLAAVVMLGTAAYFGALWLLGFRLHDFVRRAAG